MVLTDTIGEKDARRLRRTASTVARQITERAPAGSVILCMLPDTGERNLSTPLFDSVEAEMGEEEVALLRSAPGSVFSVGRDTFRYWQSPDPASASTFNSDKMPAIAAEPTAH